MRVRIIFRGLIVLRFREDAQSNQPFAVERDGQAQTLRNRGVLEAWLVSDKRHASASSTGAPSGTSGMSGMGGPNSLHVHTPRISVYGGVRIDDHDHVSHIELGKVLSGTTTLRLEGHNSVTDGVLTTKAFDEYVPKLGDLAAGARGTVDPNYDVTKIIVPHGVLRPRDLVSWDYEGNQPSTVAFMGTDFQGYVANEAVLEVGDDEGDEDVWREDKYLSIESAVGLPAKLWPLTKGTEYVDETDPNTLEILITNFAPQRRRSVFWSLHYQSLFGAVGYRKGQSYEGSDQYKAFVKAAEAFDKDEWDLDYRAMGVGYPFPFITMERPRLSNFRHGGQGIVKAPPETTVKTRDRKGATGVMLPDGSGMAPRDKPDGVTAAVDDATMPHPDTAVTAHDPWARPICPIGQDTI